MALRDNQPTSGIPVFWQDAATEKQYEWSRWIELFEATLMTESSISLEELTRDTTSNPRKKELMGGVEEQIAEKKAVSFLYIALGEAARKMLLDRKPDMDIKATKLKDLLKECQDAFQKKRNRLMDRHKFLNRKQKEDESLEQFWHVLNGLAANCDFGTQTTGLVYDIFVSNMKNTAVQERLFTEPKDNPEEALKFAVAFEQGAQQKKNNLFKANNNNYKRRTSIRCGENKRMLQVWREAIRRWTSKDLQGKKVQCRNCGKMGHYGRMCRIKQPETKQKTPYQKKVNVVQKKTEWSSSENESGEEVEILHIDEEKRSINKPFVLKGRFNRKPFHALIDTGSPITIFTKAHVEKMFGKKEYKLQPLDENEKYIEYSSNKIEFLGAIIGQVEAGWKKLDKVRALVAENGARTVIGRDRLRGLGVKLKTEGGECEINCVIKSKNKLFTEFKDLFSRRGRIEGHEINAQFKENCVPKQQKGRRIPLQLQDSVEKELEKLIKNGNIERAVSLS